MNSRFPLRALDALSEIKAMLGVRPPVFFLDFDGTLAPIVDMPELAEMSADTRESLQALAEAHPVCVVSGRPLDFLKTKVDLDTVFYAADHGHRIVGPPGSDVDFEIAPDDDPGLEAAACTLSAALRDVEGVLLEPKEVSLAVHYRRVAKEDRATVQKIVADILHDSPRLKLLEGKMVYELMPDISWGKGQAVLWLLNHLQPVMTQAFPVCIGDDITDEEMFAAVKGRGISVIVGDPRRPTQAGYSLERRPRWPDS